MDNELNWTLILHSLDYKIQQLKQNVMICNCCEQYYHELENAKAELLEYEKEYRKVLIAHQKSNEQQKEELRVTQDEK